MVKQKKKRHTYVFSGNVQKTRFRDYIASHAERLSLTGEVKNRPHGRVEAVLEGDIIDLEKFNKIMKEDKKAGMTLSDDCFATDISYELIKEKYLGVFNSFSIGYSTSYQDEMNDQFGAAMVVQMFMSRSMVSMDAKMSSMDAKMGSMDESIKDSNKAIRELTTSMNSNFELLDRKYHKITQSLDRLPKRIAVELAKVINA